VLAAQLKVLDELKAGMTGGEGDAIARNYLEAHGLGKLFTHSLGHGIGLKIHEFPSLRPGGAEVLTDKMVFSDEPGVYLAGSFGIRIEDTVTMLGGKAKTFMKKVSKELTVL
jgi:Xaa-Pro aminopeptidase